MRKLETGVIVWT